MRVSDETNVEVLRQKARLLERENERLAARVTELLRTVNTLQGMTPEMVELNLPGLVEQAAGKSPTTTTKKSERRPSEEERTKKKPRSGHGPTKQPEIEIVPEAFHVDEADKVCTVCGKETERWEGKDDVVDVVHRIPPKWVIKRCTLEKCRCPDGCTIVTADGPRKLISGGRYTIDVALSSCIEKFVFHTPTERQVRQAALVGMRITSQALWDQQWALAQLLSPLVERIKAFVLTRQWLGADLTPFLHIKKGGSTNQQVWQLACPEARYFQILGSKSAAEGRQLFEVKDAQGDVAVAFRGIAVVDGANELERIAKDLGFSVANCWSHARRNVLKANSEAPGQVKQFLDLVGKLYGIERYVAGVPPGTSDVPGGYRNKIDLERLREARDTESRAVVGDMMNDNYQCRPATITRAGFCRPDGSCG